MIELREFKPEHIETLLEDAIDNEVQAYSDDMRRYHAEIGHKCGVAYSGFYKGKLIGSVGVIIKGDIGEVWAVFSKNIKNHKKTVLRSMRVMLDDYIIPCTNFRKLRALSRVGFPQSQRLLEHMGFKKKGLRNNYYIYSRSL